jgi:cytidyltransferase-like protein
MSQKKIFVSGCFDLLHSGHIAFLNQAASFGDLYVCIGSDSTVFDLKGRFPVITQDERKYMIDALKCVHECRISKGSGLLDFIEELQDIKPDIFIVNEDGHTPQKETLCKANNYEYKVLKRTPYEDLPIRSTTTLRTKSNIPFRIDLAGGWLDQPFVSKFFPGPVLTVSIEPTIEFNHRSGMSSSTRNKAIEIWRTTLPSGNYEQNAKLLFSFENPPGTKEVSGSQDSIGIVFPGLNYLFYKGGEYWPETIESIYDEDILKWLEDHLHLVALGPRHHGYSVLAKTNITESGAKALSESAQDCWNAILNKDLNSFGESFKRSFEAQIAMFPNMVDQETLSMIEKYQKVSLGHKLSGAGGGGYLILVSDKPIENAISVKIRRRDF